MGDYRVPNEDQYVDKPNEEIILGIPDDSSEKRIADVSTVVVGEFEK